MNVVAILGSTAPSSATRRTLDQVVARLIDRGHEPALVDLAASGVGLYEPDREDKGAFAVELGRRCADADAVVLASPVYHGSFSGVLKTALDHLDGEAFAWRPVGLVACGGNIRSAGVVCDQLRSVVRALGGWSCPTHVATSGSEAAALDVAPVAGRITEMVAELEFIGLRLTLAGDERPA